MTEKILCCLDAVYLACIWIAGIAIVVMSLIIPWGVFARYVLGTGSQWPEPVAILLMVIFTFIGTAASYRAGAQIAVTMLTDRVPVALRTVLRWVVLVLMLSACVFMVVWGTSLCSSLMGQTISELPGLPVGLTYSPVPIGGFLTMLFVLEHMIFGSQAHRKIVTFGQEESPAEASTETPTTKGVA